MSAYPICITLYDCLSGSHVYYETQNTTSAEQIIAAVGLGNVVEITDPANFPNQFYILESSCYVYDATCSNCFSAANKIIDNPGISLRYWNTTEYGDTCPGDLHTEPAYVLLNCNATVTFEFPEEIVQSATTALVTSTDLSLYVGMVVNIAEYPGNCYSVLGPYTENTGCPCDEYVVTEGYADCACCLPPTPDPTCCEIPKYTQKPVHKYYLITDTECEIKTNTKFANNYYKLFTSIKYGISNCCTGVDFDKLWIKKELADFDKMQYGTCIATEPELCLYVTGYLSDVYSCGSQTATYNEFINGRWSWIFTRLNGTEGIIYWDNVNNQWICAEKITNTTIATLPFNTAYPIGKNEDWVSVVYGSCLSRDNGLSTWTIPCELCPGPEPILCSKPTNVSAQGNF